jgi:hypothetical protein
MSENAENNDRSSREEQPPAPTPKLPEAWQRLLEAIRRHYTNPPAK